MWETEAEKMSKEKDGEMGMRKKTKWRVVKPNKKGEETKASEK